MKKQLMHFGMKLGILLFLPLMAASAFAAQMEIVKLSDTMVIAQQGAGRAFALNTARGIVLIDTHVSLKRMQKAKELIEAEFKRHDYAFVINTHDHPEHVGGNGLFDPNILIGQECIVEGLKFQKTQGPTYLAQSEKTLEKEEKILAGLDKSSPAFQASTDKIAQTRDWMEMIRNGWIAPTITFRDRLTLDLGDRTVKLIFFGRGHSLSDILVNIPEEKVLLTGGACSMRSLPPQFPAYTGGMDVAQWISVLSEFVDSDAELKYIIPGHAPYLSKDDLSFLRDYYRAMWEGINQARKDGLTLDQVKSQLSLEARFGSFSRLNKPTDKVIKQHEKNIQELWAFLNPAPATPASTKIQQSPK